LGLPTQPPKLASYSGRGPLGQWVRAVALRLDIDQQRAAPSELPTEVAPVALAERLGADPELACTTCTACPWTR
jgi:RNA polymerase sigma-70 factor (ECF subfamily)